MIRILFCCHGNICRSPMAEYYFKYITHNRGLSDHFEISSAATSTEEIGNDIHRGTKGILYSNHIPFEHRSAWQVQRMDYEKYDYFIGMDTENIRNLNRMFDEDKDNKVYKLLAFTGDARDVADPWYTHNFQVTYDDIVEGCNALLQHLIETENML